MPNQFKTPGVYIQETDAFPNSAVPVETAIPAFIGYTRQATQSGRSLTNTAVRISSYTEFVTYFGAAPDYAFIVKETQDKTGIACGSKLYSLQQQTQSQYLLYNSMRLFFANGGGTCIIVSVGDYNTPVSAAALKAGIDVLKKEPEPTLILVPDAVLLSEEDCAGLQQYMIGHCALMQSRIAILDVYNGYMPRTNNEKDVITRFRDQIGVNGLNYAAAYYPWLNTTIVDAGELSFQNIQNTDLLKQLLLADTSLLSPAQKTAFEQEVNALPAPADIQKTHQLLLASSSFYRNVVTTMQQSLNLLPAAAAIAGIYTMVDNSRGVWKAPANVSVASTTTPAVTLSNEQQETLNIDTMAGKSVNVIRAFPGLGPLVWGARTLDGNSQDWRYINVRRTMIMIEQSIKLAVRAYVFEPNDANTWITVKSLISNFLTNLWKQGALAGATPDQAFSIQVGLGSTMSAQDVLDGYMNVTVMVAIVRPAEFIVISFQQQMQRS